MTENNSSETHSEQHVGPHIPKIQGETVYGPISNTNIASFIFLIIVLIFGIFAKKAIKKDNSKLKTACLNIVGVLDKEFSESFHDKVFARSYLPLIGGFFVIILFGNLFGLMIDWAGASISPTILKYIRPMNSDLDTTLVLGIITVISFLYIAIKYSGVKSTLKGYFFNFSGETLTNKIINVFVGWLHLIGVPSTIASLSLRLFGNIFAGIILIGVLSYLGVLMTSSLFEVGRFISIPFWFFEVFVAFIQAIVFAGLMISYFNQSRESHH
ncbi:MAG: F0F1 ATP synthase subunit A [Candidatus Gracilibacteria bacterium]|nr:F0F1 ATP synthase subunit A [Candidatus Gracilibacteria bacterium]